MSRPVVFRIWDGYKAFIHAPGINDSFLGPTMTLDGRFYMDGVYQNHFILEQFTGLRDRDGKPIYEGDIIEWFDYSDKACYAPVVWSSEYGWWTLGPDGAGHSGSGYALATLLKDTKRTTRLNVGNIHQHPELLLPM